MNTGIVRKWLDRGFGFLTPDGGGSDLFFHASAVSGMAGHVTLFPGQRVHYIAGSRDGRPCATSVVLVADETPTDNADDESDDE